MRIMPLLRRGAACGVVVVSVASCGPHRATATRVTVVEVVDGDTFVARDAHGVSVVVRMLGVDTPETKKPGVPVECFGPEASAFTDTHLIGRSVMLEYDIERRDRYGRTLARVRLDGEDFGLRLLRDGYARLLVIAPNGRDARAYLASELAARHAGRGLWGRCRG